MSISTEKLNDESLQDCRLNESVSVINYTKAKYESNY